MGKNQYTSQEERAILREFVHNILRDSRFWFWLVIPTLAVLGALIGVPKSGCTYGNCTAHGSVLGIIPLSFLAWGIWRLLWKSFESADAEGSNYHTHCKDWMGAVCRDPSWHWSASQRGRRYPDGTTEWSRRHGHPPGGGQFPHPGDTSGIGAQGGGL